LAASQTCTHSDLWRAAAATAALADTVESDSPDHRPDVSANSNTEPNVSRVPTLPGKSWIFFDFSRPMEVLKNKFDPEKSWKLKLRLL